MSTLLPYTDATFPDRRSAPMPYAARPDPFVYIDRQAKHLQQHIQSLLDAQSEGLLAGLSGRPTNDDDVLSNGSSTPTPTISAIASPGRPARTIPVRQPPKKKIGLRAARKGILRSMNELLTLREEEKRVIQSRIRERRDAIIEVDTFATKKGSLEKTISAMQNDRDNRRTREAKREAKSLEHEIEELELKLAEMKTRHRHLMQEISQAENSVAAKLSSYNESLSILDAEVCRYLRNPPLQPLKPDTDKSSFYSLHPKRRTLEMAREHWQAEQVELRKRQHSVDLEISALDEGGPVWLGVLNDISSFEKRLKEKMQQSIMLSKSSLNAEQDTGDHERGKRILADMEEITQRLTEHFALAEEKDWKLLVCSIGTELEALKEAQGMVTGLFKLPEDPNTVSDTNTQDTNTETNIHTSTNTNTDKLINENDASDDDEHTDEPPADLLRDTTPNLQPAISRSEDEDDEPDPAWLLSDL